MAQKKVVIIGGGVVGCSCAYYLTRHPDYDQKLHSVTIIEAVTIAAGSSGKAGGLLQIDAEPACISPLSFDLHAQLAEEHGGKDRWGYRRVYVGEAEFNGHGGTDENTSTYPGSLNWVLPSSIRKFKEVGCPDNSAQIHPRLFTMAMADMAEGRGLKIIYGSVQKIHYDDEQKGVKGVSYKRPGCDDTILLLATDVILAAGPWSSSILPSASIGGAKSHSVVMRPSRAISNNCLWVTIEPGPSGLPIRPINLELYPRPDGTLYSCNWADVEAVLPASSDGVEADEAIIQEICSALGSISDELRDAHLEIKQACHQPVIIKNGRRAKNSGPLLGPTGVKGCLLATGHDSWGVQNAPVTGLLVSEIVFEGSAKSVHTSSLDPRTILQVPLLL